LVGDTLGTPVVEREAVDEAEGAGERLGLGESVHVVVRVPASTALPPCANPTSASAYASSESVARGEGVGASERVPHALAVVLGVGAVVASHVARPDALGLAGTLWLAMLLLLAVELALGAVDTLSVPDARGEREAVDVELACVGVRLAAPEPEAGADAL